MLSVYCMAYPVTALGPGRRLALWLAGCSISCPGCVTPELWNRSTGTELTVEMVLERVNRVDRGLDGITVTGGEPFEQADELARFLEHVIAEHPEWTVLVFSGFTYAVLKRRKGAASLLALIDVLVSGPYRHRLKSRRPLVGSGNQRVHLLSTGGQQLGKALGQTAPDIANLALSDDGRQWLVGVLSKEGKKRVHGALGIKRE